MRTNRKKMISKRMLPVFLALIILMASATATPVYSDTSGSDSAQTLDPSALPDGTYSVNADMKNASNPSQASMSDAAVTKPLLLTVKDGKYSLTASFHGITIKLAGTEFFGYMKELSYWDGTEYKPVTVESKYDLIDAFNDDNKDNKADFQYPHLMSFPLINKNAGDDESGYVHLRVFVPIMESISSGSGTQNVFMKIDWSTIVSGSENAENAIKKEVQPASTVNENAGTENTESSESSSGSTSVPTETGSGSGKTQDTGNIIKIKKGSTYAVGGQTYKVTKTASAKKNGTVTFVKAKNVKKVTVPETITLADKRVYNVTVVGTEAFKSKKIAAVTIGKNIKTISKNAFAKSKVSTITLKTKLLKKSTVKSSLKGSKVKIISVKAGTKKVNKTYVKKYKKIFTKKITGRKVTVK